MIDTKRCHDRELINLFKDKIIEYIGKNEFELNARADSGTGFMSLNLDIQVPLGEFTINKIKENE